MSSERTTDSGANRRVIRAGSPLFTFWLVVACVVLLLGDAAGQGDWPVFALALAPSLLAVWLGWMLFLRPCIIVTSDRLTVRNIGRVIEMPWGSVGELRLRFGVVVELADGRHVNCWGGPFGARPGTARRAVQARRNGEEPRPDAGTAAIASLEAVRAEAMDAAAADPRRAAALIAPVVRRWDGWPLLLGAALVVAVVLEAVLR